MSDDNRPWHLYSEEARRRVIQKLSQPYDDDGARLAAAQVLTDAALYPDEALVFSSPRWPRGRVGVIVDWRQREGRTALATLLGECNERDWLDVANLVPLTPGAAQMLAAIKDGAR